MVRVGACCSTHLHWDKWLREKENQNCMKSIPCRRLSPRLTTHWSGRPTAQARFSIVVLSLWAAAHRER